MWQGALLAVVLLRATSAAAQDCYESSILKPTPFMGNDGEVFELADGSLWEVQYEYEYLYEYYPDVVVCPSSGLLILGDSRLNVSLLASGTSESRTNPSQVKSGAPGTDTRLRVETQPEIIESRIDGDFEGWEGETIVKLLNGQIWQQSEYYYEYLYAYMPEVLIYSVGGGYKMQVEGINEAVGVTRLK